MNDRPMAPIRRPGVVPVMPPDSALRPVVLLVDDEERILRSLAMLFRMQYEVRATTDAHEALRILGSERVHVIVSDQKMPVMRGADLLRQARETSPHTMRLLLTGYSELDAVVDSVNEGEIFRFLNKPWDANEIKATVAQAVQIAIASFEAPPAPAASAPVAPPLVAPSAMQLLTETGSFVAPMASEHILVIDDDAEVARTVQEMVGPNQPLHWARSLDEAFGWLEREPVGVIVSELEVGGERLTGALKALKAQHPEVVTIVLTPFQDIGTLVGLINEGQVYRLLPKPIRKGPLAMNLASALRHHRALKAAPKLAARHHVQPVKAAEEIGVAGRVMGFLSRLRARTVSL